MPTPHSSGQEPSGLTTGGLTVVRWQRFWLTSAGPGFGWRQVWGRVAHSRVVEWSECLSGGTQSAQPDEAPAILCDLSGRTS
jgi:hypothetical protein